MDDLHALLAPMEDLQLGALIDKARGVTRQRFGRVVQLYAPLYVSNECIDTCTYCGFSLANRILRRTSTEAEVLREADYLARQGFGQILLVSGDHPAHVSVAYLEGITRRLRPRFASISIEVASLTTDQYRRLIASGLDGITLYQETYDRDRYRESHLAGPKKDYDRRIAAAEAAASAAPRFLGMGILLGLADWREDAAALVRHVRELRRRFWQIEFAVSLPRLRPCASDFVPPHPVTDREFIQLVAALRLTLPDVGIVLSTRESPDLRDLLVGMGVTRMSAGSRTEPGGYLKPNAALKQFEIEDGRPPDEVARMISMKGFDPVWKDWERMGETYER